MTSSRAMTWQFLPNQSNGGYQLKGAPWSNFISERMHCALTACCRKTVGIIQTLFNENLWQSLWIQIFIESRTKELFWRHRRIRTDFCFCSQFCIEEADGLDITKQIIENEAGFKTAGCLYIKLNELFIISVSSALFWLVDRMNSSAGFC